MAAMLSFDSVSKRYGRITAVEGLSFSVSETAVVGLLGPNGSGKSTAMKLVLGLIGANAGAIELFGATPGNSGFADAIRRTGSHIESPALYERATARQNLEIQAAGHGIASSDPRIDSTLETVGLSSRSDDSVRGYSLGMRQRLSLALAIVHEPELVILDEPTNGLDPAGVVELREVIRSLPARGMTALVSSHVLGEIERTVDSVVIIMNGRLVAEGSVDELVRKQARTMLVTVPEGRGAAAVELLNQAGLPAAASGDRLRVATGGRPGSAIAETLAAAAIHPDEMINEAPDLEQVFLQLTAAETEGSAR